MTTLCRSPFPTLSLLSSSTTHHHAHSSSVNTNGNNSGKSSLELVILLVILQSTTAVLLSLLVTPFLYQFYDLTIYPFIYGACQANQHPHRRPRQEKARIRTLIRNSGGLISSSPQPRNHAPLLLSQANKSRWPVCPSSPAAPWTWTCRRVSAPGSGQHSFFSRSSPWPSPPTVSSGCPSHSHSHSPPLAAFPEMGMINLLLLLQILTPGARTFWANLL